MKIARIGDALPDVTVSGAGLLPDFGRSISEGLMAARWMVRRWSVGQLWRRVRLPIRRRRWAAELLTASDTFRKAETARLTSGAAIVFGEFSGVNGLGRAATYDVAMLRERHSELRLVDICPYLKGQTPTRLNLPRAENVYFFCQPDTFATVFRLIDPSVISDAYRIARWVWETPKLPKEWRFGQSVVHEVWAPSAFCADVFAAALDVPVRTIEHAVVAPAHSLIDMRDLLSIDRSAFVGLAVMDIVSCPERKNPWAHVRAWQGAFRGSKNAILIMKVRVGKRTRFVLDEIRELIGNDKNIILLTEDYSNDEIAALFRSADIYLSLHRSEGFGLNILEALLLGKQVVATNWSANSEYGPRYPNYHGIAYELIPYKDWTAHYHDADFKWADANLDMAIDQLRKRFKHQAHSASHYRNASLLERQAASSPAE